jgi:hypothetical protein
MERCHRPRLVVLDRPQTQLVVEPQRLGGQPRPSGELSDAAQTLMLNRAAHLCPHRRSRYPPSIQDLDRLAGISQMAGVIPQQGLGMGGGRVTAETCPWIAQSAASAAGRPARPRLAHFPAAIHTQSMEDNRLRHKSRKANKPPAPPNPPWTVPAITTAPICRRSTSTPTNAPPKALRQPNTAHADGGLSPMTAHPRHAATA